jgi:hypothetical protein
MAMRADSAHPVSEHNFAAVFPLSACSGNALYWRVIAAAASPHIVTQGNLSTRSVRNFAPGGNLFRRGISVRTQVLSWCDKGLLNLRCSADGTGGPGPPPRYVLLRPLAGRAHIHGTVCHVSCSCPGPLIPLSCRAPILQVGGRWEPPRDGRRGHSHDSRGCGQARHPVDRPDAATSDGLVEVDGRGTRGLRSTPSIQGTVKGVDHA